MSEDYADIVSEDYTDTSPRIDSYPRRLSNDAAIITSQDQMNRVQRLETESEINILPSGILSLPYFLLWVSSSCRLAVGVLLRIRNKRVQVIWSGLQLPLSRLADAVVHLVERVRDATVVRRSTGARSVFGLRGGPSWGWNSHGGALLVKAMPPLTNGRRL